jgi:hypothetical protein
LDKMQNMACARFFRQPFRRSCGQLGATEQPCGGPRAVGNVLALKGDSSPRYGPSAKSASEQEGFLHGSPRQAPLLSPSQHTRLPHAARGRGGRIGRQAC